MSKLKRKLFLATPITPLLQADGLLQSQAQHFLQEVLSDLRQHLDTEVFCAIEREKWGAQLMTGEECTPLDFFGLQESEAVLALPDHSYGVHLELGWASAFKKPILLLLNEFSWIHTPLVEGLGTLTSTERLFYRSRQTLPEVSQWKTELLRPTLEILRAFLEKEPAFLEKVSC